MAGLISDQLINQLRNVAYKQLVTDITIKRPSLSADAYGSSETLATVATTTCWVKPQFKGDITTQPGGLAGHDSAAEIRLRWGTDIQVGDFVEVAGSRFRVQDINAEATISLYLKAWVKRIEN